MSFWTERVSSKPISGMRGDVVGHREQLRVHELLGPRGDLVARGVRPGELRDQAGHVERLLERRHLLQHVARGLALGRRVLREGCQCDEESQSEKRTVIRRCSIHDRDDSRHLIVYPCSSPLRIPHSMSSLWPTAVGEPGHTVDAEPLWSIFLASNYPACCAHGPKSPAGSLPPRSRASPALDGEAADESRRKTHSGFRRVAQT